jgi:hypothetical protein
MSRTAVTLIRHGFAAPKFDNVQFSNGPYGEICKFPPGQNTFPGGKVAAQRTDEGTGTP